MTIMRPPQHGQGGGSWSEEVAPVLSLLACAVRGRWHIESPSTEFELVGAMAVGEQAVVTDAMEAGWEDVEQEAAHELADVEAHDLAALTAVLAIVLPAETDMGRVEIEQTAVGDRDAMRIAREIGQDLQRTAIARPGGGEKSTGTNTRLSCTAPLT